MTKKNPNPKPSDMHPKSLANLQQFQRGPDARRGSGRPPGFGASVWVWMNVLLDTIGGWVADDGKENEKYDDYGLKNRAVYNDAALKKIAKDPDAPRPKRVAAQNLLELLDGGKEGREALNLLLDRTEGKPGIHVNMDVKSEVVKRIIMVGDDEPDAGDDK